MVRQRVVLWVLASGFILVGLGLLGNLFVFHDNKKSSNNSSSTDFNSISDSTVGVSFSISKKLEPIDVQILRLQKADLLYGYSPPGVSTVECAIYQTKRLKPGNVALADLAAGTLIHIKETHPDVKLDNLKKVLVPEGLTGAAMKLSYKDGGADIIRLELVATTDTRTTFAFCFSPKSLYQFYANDFVSFFDSIKITSTAG